MKRLYLFAVVIFTAVSNASALTNNALNNIFHHKGKLSDKISCYFDQEPVFNYLPSYFENKKDGWKTAKFFFPMATINTGDCKQKIKEINAAEHESYRITISEASLPMRGISLTVKYDPAAIGFEYETFTAIQKQPGIVFKLFHKNFLAELNNKGSSIQQYASVKKRPHVVLDFGHGGNDAGKVGCFDIKEKDITLLVGMKVAQLLKKEQLVVFLTRNCDRFVPLENRTTFANDMDGDLFVSIHANGAPSKTASGVETFCLVPSLFNKGAIENLEHSLGKAAQDFEIQRFEKSTDLAQSIHQSVIVQARNLYPAVPDRKVKKAISQVLLGSEMPAALIEIGFLSNEHEAYLLNSREYQECIAQGICKGIVTYLNTFSSNCITCNEKSGSDLRRA